MNDIEINKILSNVKFKFAKTMPKFPHEYTLKETWHDEELFVKCVKHIYENGKTELFFKTFNKYYYANGYKYWCYAMINPHKENLVHWTEKKSFITHSVKHYAENLCILINRAKL